MNYKITASASKITEGVIESGNNKVSFGVTKGSELPSPAELLLASFAACCLKNVERFSEMMHFEYLNASIQVFAERQEKPPMINSIRFEIEIKSSDPKLNKELLLRNLEKFGTIYNTLNTVCAIKGEVVVVM